MILDNLLFWLLMIAHLLGDFYFQPECLAGAKQDGKKGLFTHAGISAGCILLCLAPIMNLKLLGLAVALAITHLAADAGKGAFMRWNQKRTDAGKRGFRTEIFLGDQILHILIIVITVAIYTNVNQTAWNGFGIWLASCYGHIGMPMTLLEFIRTLFLILVIGKPANILIREVNRKENILPPGMLEDQSKSLGNAAEVEYKNAGRLIGTLERVLIVVLLFFGQYAAIGLIFTAKSLTRYDKIKNEPSFAEYYLVGTLLSVLIAVAAFLLSQPLK